MIGVADMRGCRAKGGITYGGSTLRQACTLRCQGIGTAHAVLVGRNPRSGFRRTVLGFADTHDSRAKGGITCGGSTLRQPGTTRCQSIGTAHAVLVGRNPRSGFRRTVLGFTDTQDSRAKGGITCGGSTLRQPGTTGRQSIGHNSCSHHAHSLPESPDDRTRFRFDRDSITAIGRVAVRAE